jgi:hypothetical protein
VDNHTNGNGWYSPSFDTVSALVGLHLNTLCFSVAKDRRSFHPYEIFMDLLRHPYARACTMTVETYVSRKVAALVYGLLKRGNLSSLCCQSVAKSIFKPRT